MNSNFKNSFFLLLCFSFSCPLFSQDNLKNYNKAESLFKAGDVKAAYRIFKDLDARIPETDTLYDYSLWYYNLTLAQLEAGHRTKEEFTDALAYGEEALRAIRKGVSRFNEQFDKRLYFMIKNVLVSNMGLGKFEDAKKYKQELYAAQQAKLLPEGLDQYFNFDFFKWEGKNVWGYEWFEELPKDRFSKSFTKVVYYVYSTNPDGTDKDQLYRLHVLMFHGEDSPFDYVLTKQNAADNTSPQGTFYTYTYQEDIDFEQLKLDIKEVLKGNYQPDKRMLVPRKN
jgi:tetratricopeptide (TPR) repeat protein